VAAVLFAYFAATCSNDDQLEACPTPAPGSVEDGFVQDARSQANFDLVYPCFLPNTETLESSAVTGTSGRQQAEFVWNGTFDLTVRQSQFPPAVTAPPAGASRSVIDLYPNVRADLIEVNDASGDSLYHLLWQRENIYYELQALGPGAQRDLVLRVARSLE
jgi:hypothetical protein